MCVISGALSQGSDMSKLHSHARGPSWSEEETQCLLDIWSDEFISTQLSTTHKNSKVYAEFARRLVEQGFNRSGEQCRVKAKRLRSHYMRVRRALEETGDDCAEKEKFQWFDQLDKILGLKGVDDTVDVVESCESPSSPPGGGTADQACPPTGCMSPVSEDASVDGVESSNSSMNAELTHVSPDEGVSGCSSRPSPTENKPNAAFVGKRLPIPGAQARKRRVKPCRADEDFREYMVASKKMMENMMAAEERHVAREEAAFERLLQAQREDSERRFQAMLAQQQATNQMFRNLIDTIAHVGRPSQHHSSSTSAPSLPQQKEGKDKYSSSPRHFKEELIDKLNPEVATCGMSPGRMLQTADHDNEAERERTVRSSEEETQQSACSQAEDSSTNTHVRIKDEPEHMD